MKILHCYRYQANDLSEARLCLMQLDNGYAVDRILPAGMDIAPDRWKFRSLDMAEKRFSILDTTLQGQGFHIVQTA